MSVHKRARQPDGARSRRFRRVGPWPVIAAAATVLLGLGGCLSKDRSVTSANVPVELNYVSTGLATPVERNGRIDLRILDERRPPVFFIDHRGSKYADQQNRFFHLASTATQSVQGCFAEALTQKGYVVANGSTAHVEVGLRTLLVQRYGRGMRGTAYVRVNVAFQLRIAGPDGVVLTKDLQAASPGTPERNMPARIPVSKYVGNLLSQKLSRAIDEVMDSVEVTTAIAKAAGTRQGQPRGEQEPFTPPPGNQERLAGNSGDRDPIVQKTTWTPSPERKLWVLAIGIEQYGKPGIQPVSYAKADAERVRDWFVNLRATGITKDSVHVLLDEEATRERLLTEINWLRKVAMPEDAVFVYFAGHGAPERSPDGLSVDAKYLVLFDTDKDRLFATGMPLDELTLKLNTIRARTQVVILEACYMGSVGQEIRKKTWTANLELRLRLLQNMGTGTETGRVILSASTGEQLAIGDQEVKGGLFTHYLLEAWGDGSQPLLSDRFEAAKSQVRRAANSLDSVQEPTKFGDRSIDVVLTTK